MLDIGSSSYSGSLPGELDNQPLLGEFGSEMVFVPSDSLFWLLLLSFTSGDIEGNL